MSLYRGRRVLPNMQRDADLSGAEHERDVSWIDAAARMLGPETRALDGHYGGILGAASRIADPLNLGRN